VELVYFRYTLTIDQIIDDKQKTLLVHRKGSTRAFPPHHPLIPVDYQVFVIFTFYAWYTNLNSCGCADGETMVHEVLVDFSKQRWTI
jgi:hypothetical protein